MPNMLNHMKKLIHPVGRLSANWKPFAGSLLVLLLFFSLTPHLRLESAEKCRADHTEQKQPQAAASAETPQPVQWQMHELALNAARNFRNPYTDVTITAQFSGPAGAQKTVRGFWDGGKRFRVRFTPPAPGHWSYKISSTPADSGLTQSGSFTVTAASSAQTGFVRRDPAYPTSFVYDNGERYFMMGTTYYEIVRTACADTSEKAVWQVAVENAKQFGINKVRMLVHPWGAPGSQEEPGFYSKADFYPTALPFVDNDHDRLDIRYWQRLDDVIRYLESQGMVADLLLFTNSDLAFGTQLQDERYLRYILARYAAFPNVIWCLSNEWEYTAKDQAYWDTMGEIVHSEDPWMVEGDAYRALSIHNQTGGTAGGKFSYFASSWPVHAIVQYGVRNGQFKFGDQWGNYSIVQNRGHEMPVVNDEYGYIGETRTITLTQTLHRNALWGTVIGGGYASAGDGRFFNDGPQGERGRVLMTAHWHDAAEYQDIKHLVDFWTTNQIPYWKMAPHNALIEDGKRVYLLADLGKEYVVYAAAGGDFTLPLPDGTYNVQRFDPQSGKSTTLPPVTGGSPLSFSLPDSRDWVLHITQQSS
ncbi:MAG: DUF5060 domain-containing protein [Caldilineaceae bacterium]|nr:DUF5060 domain-containing protein [Caldilineaceae bacterium]